MLLCGNGCVLSFSFLTMQALFAVVHTGSVQDANLQDWHEKGDSCEILAHDIIAIKS